MFMGLKVFFNKHKSLIVFIIISIIILVVISYLFRNENLVNITSLIILLFYYIIKKDPFKIKIENILPVILVLLVVISPYIINYFNDKPEAKLFIIKYVEKETQDISVPLDGHMYLIYNPKIDIYFFLILKPLQTSDPHEQIPWGGLFNELISCDQTCARYYMTIQNIGVVPINNIKVDGSIFTDQIKFKGVNPKITQSENTGSYGRGGFHFDVDEINVNENLSLNMFTDKPYNFTVECKITDEIGGLCTLSIYEGEIIYINPSIYNELNINEQSKIELPPVSGDIAIYAFNPNSGSFEDGGCQSFTNI